MSEIIWFNKEFNFSHFKGKMTPNTLSSLLGMEWWDVGPDYITARMPVDERTKQPYGLLHGGASVALAETVGSVASFLTVDSNRYSCVGLEINANHLKSVKDGFVYATAKPIRLGKTTHVWDIKITNDAQQLICISRLTVAILDKQL